MLEIERYNREIEQIFKKFPSYQKVGSIAYKEGLEGMLLFDERLESPHKRYLTIHVAGTNGKGSVSHMLASVLMSCGAKVGLYTSPHLVDFRERIKVDGEMISKGEVLNFLDEHRVFMESHSLSFFEITTAMAFDHFAKSGVDIAVIETGLGGRLDSTNIITPIVSTITNISIDHKEQLGVTLAAIAKEKGGIIKQGIPIVVGQHSNSSREIFDTIAKEKGAPIIYAQNSLYSNISLDDYQLDLHGHYQRENLVTALTTLKILSKESNFRELLGEGWSDENIRAGLKNVIKSTGLRGRWESLSLSPKVICDGGHNVAALSQLFTQLRKESYKRLFCLIGLTADKEVDKIVGLLPQSAYYLYTEAQIERAMKSDSLAERCAAAGLEGEVVHTVAEGIERFKLYLKEGDFLFIGGSNFIVGEAIQFFENRDNFFAN